MGSSHQQAPIKTPASHRGAQLRFKLGTEISTALAGSFVFVRRGTAHCFQNTADQPARILVLFTLAGMERFFDRFASVPAGSSDRNAFHQIGREVDLRFVGPTRSNAASSPLLTTGSAEVAK